MIKQFERWTVRPEKEVKERKMKIRDVFFTRAMSAFFILFASLTTSKEV